MMRRAAAMVLLMGASPSFATAQDAALADQGRKLLEANCSRCHAVGAEGDSTFKEAPPFRDLHRKYPVTQLAESLAEGITTGHSAMPEFTFKPNEIDAIIAYLDSFRKP